MMSVQELMQEAEPMEKTMRILKTESREVEVESTSELKEFIESMPEGMVANIRLEVWIHNEI